jgi:hypothetical protein
MFGARRPRRAGRVLATYVCMTVLALAASNAVAQLLGGYIAAALDKRRPLIAALAFGAVFMGVHLVVAAVGADARAWPVRLHVGQAVLVVVAAALGGVLRVHARPPAPG